jgi:hypothetical protein
MDASEFLTRIVAPGAFYAFAFRRIGSEKLGHRFYPQSALPAAVDWMKHMANEADVWYAVASFKGQRRRQDSAENLKCFWYDADISRQGDGKAPGAVYKDIQELVGWLLSVKASLALPNLWISSGYGVHLYWVLDDAIPAKEWVEHAKRFRNLLSSLGARGDIGISADSARILRAPETFNYKVPDDRKPVRNITPVKLALPACYETAKFLSRLGSTTVVKLSQRPAGKPASTSGLLAAAKANISRPPPADFASITAQCLQVQKTLAEGGEHDPYSLWHLLSNLAYFCDDRDAAHAIACKHATYSEDDTDSKLALTEKEHRDKSSFGAPSCESIDNARKGVCDNCPHFGTIKGPYSLGFNTILPFGYNQAEGSLMHDDKKLLNGIVDNPQLYHLGYGTHRLTFNYIEPGVRTPWHIAVNEIEVGSTVKESIKSFVSQGISLARGQALPFADFIMAWIKELRAALKVIDASAPSFGWVYNDETKEYTGLSIAGTLYRADGTEILSHPGDPTIHKNYQPRGDANIWRTAAEFVVGNKPELQTMVAASFAAPLMQFVGESGILSVWSSKSGARKTSAFRAGTAVWCNPITGMSAIRDTTNSVQQSLGETKIMPVFWDEIHTASKDQIALMVEMMFNITQGRGRARLDQRMEQRSVGYWRTLMILSSNKPAAESIEQDRAHTNAGLLRVFEYALEPLPGADQDASSIVQTVEKNYGHVGQTFARWLATNVPEVEATIKAVRGKLYKEIPDIKPDERFHVAVITGVVSGAVLAHKLNLITLDIPGIYKFMKGVLYSQRQVQQAENTTSNDTKFERFIADHTDDLLVTQSFSPRGARPKSGIHTDRVKIVKQPSVKSSRALIHIGLDEREMRFDYKAFKDWCFRNHETRTAILDYIETVWGGKKTRAVLAIGTEWSSGAMVHYVRLDLNPSNLQHHLNWGTPAPATNIVPFPPAAAE